MRCRTLLLALVAAIVILELAPLAMLFGLPVADNNGLPMLDTRRLLLLGKSVVLAGAVGAAATGIGLPLGLRLAGRPRWLLACLAPFFFPPYLQAMLWPRIFEFAGIDHGTIPPMTAAIWIFTICYAPIVMLLTAGGLRNLAPETVEAASLARPQPAIMRRIVLPSLLPNLTAGFVLAFVFTLGNFEVPDLLGFKVYPVEIFIACSAYYDEQGAALLTLPLVTVTLTLVAFQARVMAGRPYLLVADAAPISQTTSRPPPFAAAYLAVAVLLPLAALIAGGRPANGFATAWSIGMPALLLSLVTALVGAILATGMALPLAWYCERYHGRLANFVDFASQIPLAFPSLVIGLGIIRIANQPIVGWLYDSTACYVLAVAIAHLPFAAKILAARLRTIPTAIEETARIARGGPIAFSRITVPLAAPALAVSVLTVFVLALANLGLPLLTLPPGRETLPLKLYNYLHYGAQETVYALGTMLVVTASATAAVLLFLSHKTKRQS